MTLDHPVQVYIGNSTQNHLYRLEELCVKNLENPYQNHIVVVPDQGLASYIWHHISKKYDVPLFSIQVLSLGDGITTYLAKDNLSLTACTIAILGKLHVLFEQEGESSKLIEKLRKGSSFNTYRFAEWASLELMSYFLLGASFSRIRDKEQLELLEILKKAILQDLPHLQQGIQLQRTAEDKIHIFGFSSLHPTIISLFSKCEAIFYFTSPCMMFWSDTFTDKEIYKITNPKWDEALIQELFWDRNPLLANFATVGKSFARCLEESIGQYQEEYFIPYGVAKHPFYDQLYRQEVVVETNEKGTSLLRLIQADLLTLSGRRNNKIPVSKEEINLQIIKAKSKLEEVEHLVELLHSKADVFSKEAPIEAAFCLVYVSNLSQYIPYIERVFSREGVQLQYQLHGSKIEKQLGSLTQGFFSSLNLLNERVTKDQLLSLLKCTSFQRKLGLSNEELQIVLKYIENSSFKSGYCNEQLDRVLRNEGIETTQQQTFSGTWVEFEQEAVISWISNKKTDAELDITTIEIIARWIEKMSELFAELACLQDNNNRSLRQKILQIKEYLEKYFVIDFNAKEEKSELEVLYSALGILLQYGSSNSTRFIKLEEVVLLLQREVERINKKNNNFFSKEIVFAEIGTLQGHPADIIAYLGMDETSFSSAANNQNIQDTFSLRMLIDEKNRIDQLYTYQFIESLILAAKAFFISYSLTGYGKDSEARPAPCVSELIEMTLSGFDIEGSLYYESTRKHRYARKHIDICPTGDNSPQILPKAIDIRLLQEVAKNPIKAYLRHTLGIYIAAENESDEAADPTIATLWNMRRLMLASSGKDYDKTVDAMTHIPPGLVGKAHRSSLKLEKNS